MIRRWRDERGVALIAVMWFVVAAAGLSLTLVRHGQADLILSHGQLDAVQARAFLDAGVARGVAELMRSRDRRTPPSSLSLTLEGSQITVEIASESGKVDLNAADPVLITSLARTLAVPEDRAQALGKAVAARRGAQQAQGPLDKRPGSTGAAGAGASTAANPFRNVDELRYLPVVDDSVYQAMAPYLTVYTGLQQPQARLAAEPVRQALELRRTASGDQGANDASGNQGPLDAAPSATAAAPAATNPVTAGTGSSSSTAAHPPAGQASGQSAAPPAAGEVVQDPKGIYSLMVQVQLPGGYVSALRAVVWLARPTPPTNGSPLPPVGGVVPQRPYRVLDWTPAALTGKAEGGV